LDIAAFRKAFAEDTLGFKIKIFQPIVFLFKTPLYLHAVPQNLNHANIISFRLACTPPRSGAAALGDSSPFACCFELRKLK
jgi:hypothetical protein